MSKDQVSVALNRVMNCQGILFFQTEAPFSPFLIHVCSNLECSLNHFVGQPHLLHDKATLTIFFGLQFLRRDQNVPDEKKKLPFKNGFARD